MNHTADLPVKITMEDRLIAGKSVTSDVKTLLKWEAEGKLDVANTQYAKNVPVKNAPYNWPGARTVQRPAKKKSKSTNSKFNLIAAVLFPSKSQNKLNMTEINHVAHLSRHIMDKREFFVTEDSELFLAQSRRKSIKASLGVNVLTPAELVALLCDKFNWPSP